jgi:hypothetical protein
MRTTKTTDWIPTTDAQLSERCATWVKGFDCRGGCKPGCPHENAPKGDYGQDGDQLELAVRWPQEPIPGSTTVFEEAVNLSLILDVRDGTRIPSQYPFALVRPAAPVYVHTSYVTDPEHVREPAQAVRCPLLRSEWCFKNGAMSFMQAEKIWLPIDTAVFAPLVPQAYEHLDDLLKLTTGVWDRLRIWGRDQIAGLRAAHLELPKRCPTCDGKGLVPK